MFPFSRDFYFVSFHLCLSIFKAKNIYPEPFGTATKIASTVVIAASAFKTVKDILSTSWSLGVFPQGGIRPYGSDINDLKKGFIVIAKNAKADIVPVAIAEFTGYPKLKPFTRRKVRLHVGKPISYKLSPEEITYEWCRQITEFADYTNSAQKPEKDVTTAV